MQYLPKNPIKQIVTTQQITKQIIKHQILIALLAISGFTISSLAIAGAANAQTTIMAALYQNPPTTPSITQTETRNNSAGQITIALSNSPEAIAITENILTSDRYDRIVTLSHTQGIACLVNGQGSQDGAVMCGLIDYE